jgi:short-subunit dehydrogenase
MNILITGNPKENITQSLKEIYPNMHTVSRSSVSDYSLDLSVKENVEKLAKISVDYDVFINCALIPDFGQTQILQHVWTEWKSQGKSGHIISFGSAVDYYFRPDNRLYPVEKRALKDLNRSLSKHVAWYDSKIRCTYFSFGGVSTEKTKLQWNHYKHFSVNEIVEYVKFIIDVPDTFNIDEMHITPIQPLTKKEMKRLKSPNMIQKWNSGDERIYLINEE